MNWRYEYIDKSGGKVQKDISSNFQIKGDNMKWAIESNSDFSYRLRIKVSSTNYSKLILSILSTVYAVFTIYKYTVTIVFLK